MGHLPEAVTALNYLGLMSEMYCLGARQEYWSGLPFPSPGDLPSPGIKPGSPALQTDALQSEPLGKPLEAIH